MEDAINVTVAEQQKDIEYMKDKLDSIESKLDDFIKSADDKYARNEEFIFWRNVLISGILLSIFLAVILQLITK